MSWIYNNESDEIIIDEVSNESEQATPTQAEDIASPDKAEEMVLPIISSVYSENPIAVSDCEELESDKVPTEVSRQDNDSNFSDSDIELVSVDYTNDTLSDSSESSKVQTVKKKRRRRKLGQMMPNPCQGKPCKNGCNLLTQAERQALYEEFKILDAEARRAYVQKWINITIPDHAIVDGKIVTMKTIRDYYFMTQSRTPTKVCAKFFSATLGISQGMISNYLKEKVKDATKSIEVGEETVYLGTNRSIRIDIVEMIREIERREEVWNQDMPGRHSLNVDGAWGEICRALVRDYSRQTIGEQEYIKQTRNTLGIDSFLKIKEKTLMAKWCDLKSLYFKYFSQKLLLNTFSPTAKPPFMAYSKLLTFLDKTSHFSPDASNEDCSSEKPDSFTTVFIIGNQSVETTSPEPTETSKRRSSSFAIDEDHLIKKPKLGEEQSNPYGILSLPYTVEDYLSPEAPIVDCGGGEELRAIEPKSNFIDTNSGVVDNEESDLIFFKSLLPIIKTLDQQKKLQFRLGVITNLQSLTTVQTRQDSIVNASGNSQQSGSQQSQVSQAAPQNPAVTSTSLSANRSEGFNTIGARSPNFSVLISSCSDDSDSES